VGATGASRMWIFNHQFECCIHDCKSFKIQNGVISDWGGLIMQLEEYFNFLAADDIRLKGTRIGIETILFDYLFRARTPEEIANTYPSLTLEQVYATILY
jgi:hypothetical protein